MHSHRRSRGKIFFEVLCAVSVGASFVGAWIQTGAWAFLAPAFVFTLFGLYWSFDMFGGSEPVAARAVETVSEAPVEVAVAQAQPEPAEPQEIRFERFEPPAEAEHETAASAYAQPESVAEAAPVAEAKPKRRSKKAAKPSEPVIERFEPERSDEPAYHEPHIEQLFDPQPFARHARPAFGKRARGPGPRPLPA